MDNLNITLKAIYVKQSSCLSQILKYSPTLIKIHLGWQCGVTGKAAICHAGIQ